DGFLQRWEKEMKDVDTLVIPCKRTVKDKEFGKVSEKSGAAMFKRPNLAFVHLQKKDKPEEDYERYVCTGNFLYEFAPQFKELRARALPQPKSGNVSDDNFLSMLFGMKAADAKKRYDLKLTREDDNFIYIHVFPRNNADKAEFSQARIVINKQNFLPRQLWFVEPNKNEITWDLLT